jgi:putative colanic acid biosynthesis acetyltransferase WcaF
MRLDLFDNSDFDRGASPLKEAFWILCKCLFFLNPFPWPSSLRTFWLRLFGAKIGSGLVIRSGVNITFPWRFEVGDHVWIGENVCVLSMARVRIGSHVCISQRAFLCTGSHDPQKESFDLITRPIEIDSSVWIAATSFIGPGVTVGQDSIIAAGSVVMKPIPARSFVKGNPAQISARREMSLESTAA